MDAKEKSVKLFMMKVII